MTRVKEVANPVKLNAVCNNKRKLNKLERTKVEKHTRKKKTKKIRGTAGIDAANGANLPEDIIVDILIMLPAESLIRFRCVCKSWYNLFKTTSFAELQLDYSSKNRSDGIAIDSYKKFCYLDYASLPLPSTDSVTSYASPLYNKLAHIAYPLEYEKKKIVGSCNGMICYISCKDDTIIFNPLTKDFRKIPAPPKPGYSSYGHGFAYDLKTEDYKLVIYSIPEPRVAYIQVYSFKLNSWKTISNIPFQIPSRKLVFFKGFFHWVGVSFNGTPPEIGCFDATNDTVKFITLPQLHNWDTHIGSAQLCVLGGCLCLIVRCTNSNIWDVWTMKDYGVAESWTKIITVDGGKLSWLQHSEDSKQYFKNDAILVHQRDMSTYLYDLNREVARELEIDGILPGHKTWAFSGSLVSPN